MSKDDLIKEEKNDLKLRDELQSKLQSAIGRSASTTEINRIRIETRGGEASPMRTH